MVGIQEDDNDDGPAPLLSSKTPKAKGRLRFEQEADDYDSEEEGECGAISLAIRSVIPQRHVFCSVYLVTVLTVPFAEHRGVTLRTWECLLIQELGPDAGVTVWV